MACREETEEIPNLAQEESAEEIKSVVILQEEEQGEADDNYKTEFPSPGTENNYDDQEFVQLDAEDETAQQNPRRPQDSSNPYRNSRTRTIHEVGRTAITFGQAKLFGLVDVSGNLTLEKLVGSSGGNKDFQRKHIELLAKKPATKPTEDADALGEFKPLKSEQALRAMRNPRCGYDFVSRLNERGDPLEALTSAPPAAKKDLEAEKELYAFRQDKLSCPSCKRTQSFDEFVEKRRQCSQCQQKYVKLNVCDVFSFERRLKEKTQRRQANVARIEEEMYGFKPFKAKPVRRTSAGPAADRAASPTPPAYERLSAPPPRVPAPSLARTAELPRMSATATARAPAKQFNTTPVALKAPVAVADKENPNRSKGAELSKVVSQDTAVVRAKKDKMAAKFRALLEY